MQNQADCLHRFVKDVQASALAYAKAGASVLAIDAIMDAVDALSNELLSTEESMQHMSYRGFEGACRFNAKFGFFTGRLVGILGVVSFRGDTVEEAQQEFIISVDEFIASGGQLPRAEQKSILAVA